MLEEFMRQVSQREKYQKQLDSRNILNKGTDSGACGKI